MIIAMHHAGLSVVPEWPVVSNDGRRGRIDLVVSRCGASVAIEIDARKPRRKSLDKLRCFNGGRVLVLRGVAGNCQLHEIDAVVPLRVKLTRGPVDLDRSMVGEAYRSLRRAAR
jgi:hypothetical protein